MAQALHVGIAGLGVSLERLALGGFLGQLLAQRFFDLARVGLQFGGGGVVRLQPFAQGLQFGVTVGATLKQRALLRFAVVQASTQRIAFGMKLSRALHQLPETGGEMI
ncbi:Uncharacterised protein [Bordetella ansorpii]|uniref:Uncharacterized protein n=1 Tax=Bordetella ansorpii TaxID=288768 RepID=A0A157SSB0_9BORD|nr:Uncharacterised protein [Bordetella ansorpii]